MSILINGIELPKDKAVAVVIHPDGTAYAAKMVAGVCTEYLSDCTAAPVSPHVRPIDANSLVKLLRNKYEDNPWVSSAVLDWFLAEIKNAPTVIPTEEDT